MVSLLLRDLMLSTVSIFMNNFLASVDLVKEVLWPLALVYTATFWENIIPSGKYQYYHREIPLSTNIKYISLYKISGFLWPNDWKDVKCQNGHMYVYIIYVYGWHTLKPEVLVGVWVYLMSFSWSYGTVILPSGQHRVGRPL